MASCAKKSLILTVDLKSRKPSCPDGSYLPPAPPGTEKDVYGLFVLLSAVRALFSSHYLSKRHPGWLEESCLFVNFNLAFATDQVLWGNQDLTFIAVGQLLEGCCHQECNDSILA